MCPYVINPCFNHPLACMQAMFETNDSYSLLRGYKTLPSALPFNHLPPTFPLVFARPSARSMHPSAHRMAMGSF